MSDILNITQLDVELQNKQILSQVNLSLASGEIIGLVGPSGCGKTTLLNTIAGFIKQTSGDITLKNNQLPEGVARINNKNLLAPEKRHLGMIFQDYALFPHLNVRENIAFGISKLSKQQQACEITKIIDLLKLNGLEQQFPHQLSGGQQQRVAIARALAPKPSILLLDEPFSNIDARLRNALIIEMRRLLKQLNIAAIFVTHNKDEVFTFADKIAVMSAGSILQLDTPAKVCNHPSNWQVADFLQLGSWLPLSIKQQTDNGQTLFDSALGSIALPENKEHLQLLLKPQHLSINQDKAANVKVEHISITEQGYHYLLSSLTQNQDIRCSHISLYSDTLYELDQKLHLQISPHKLQAFAGVENTNTNR